MRKLLVILFLFLFAGCETTKVSIPQINESTRVGLQISDPIQFSLLDARRSNEDSKKVLQSIRDGLSNVYSSKLEFIPYFQETSDDLPP